MLKKHYTIVDVENDYYENPTYQRFHTIQPSEIDSFINDTVDDFKVRKLRIRVNFKAITEAISQEDIKDFCEMYLAYLLDEGYALAFRESGRITQIDFVKPNVNAGTWSPGNGGPTGRSFRPVYPKAVDCGSSNRVPLVGTPKRDLPRRITWYSDERRPGCLNDCFRNIPNTGWTSP
jgi:hypothetical protein